VSGTRQRDADLDDEIRSHLQMATADRIARGQNAEDAAASARREFGNEALVKEVTREMWGWMWLERLLQDVRYALVTMRRNPGVTAATLLTLALGIGATTAVFSVVYGVLLRPLPYPNADRLVRLSEEQPGGATTLREPMLSNLTYVAWSQSPRTIDAIAAYLSREYTVSLPDGAERLGVGLVTPSLFDLVGATPALGRFLSATEGGEAAPSLIVLSDRCWRERFRADPSAVGRSIMVNDKPYGIIGVARPGFEFPDRDTLMWAPMPPLYQLTPDAVAGGRGSMSLMLALARLAPGATAAQAEAEGTAAARTMPRPLAADGYFGVGGPVVVHARGVVAEQTSGIRAALLVLAGAVVLVLLTACANVANLFLSRGIARQPELMLRAAIGASRGRIARQLLTESAVLSAIGGAGGLAIAWALVRLSPLLTLRSVPRLESVRLDGRVLTFAALVSIFTTLAAGLAPAARGARVDLAGSLHGGDGASAGGFRGVAARRLRDVFLVAESAFAVMLVVGATLLARSFIRLMQVDAGYTAAQVLTAQVFLPGGGDDKASAPRVRQLVATALARTRAERGIVAAAGVGNSIPLDNVTMLMGFPVPGQLDAETPRMARARAYAVTPGYGEALSLRVRAGRLFTEADLTRGIRPWVVNEEFARLYLPPDPVGFLFPRQEGDDKFTAEIVGVVGNVLKDGNDTEPLPERYILTRDLATFRSRFEIVVRTAGDPAAFAPFLREILHNVAPTAAVETATLSSRVAESVERPRLAVIVLAAFAAFALALAAVGLYGVQSYVVSQRRRELGMRAALGAERRDLVGLVLREGMARTVVGIALGLGGAAGLTRLMQGALFGVGPLDGVSFVVAPVVLLVVAAAACLLPAHRAASIDPAEALRCE
jgi:predicted permease